HTDKRPLRTSGFLSVSICVVSVAQLCEQGGITKRRWLRSLRANVVPRILRGERVLKLQRESPRRALKQILQRELHYPRLARSLDPAEVGVVQISARRREVGA